MKDISKEKAQNLKEKYNSALVVTSVASMVDQFLSPSIELLVKLGYVTTVCCNFVKGNTCDEEKIIELKNRLTRMNVKCVQIDFDRDIYRFDNHIKAYRQLKRIIRGKIYNIIHCHSPIGGLLTRIVAKDKYKVIYTAHGFHFYRGAPLKNWIMYYPIERICAHWTDTLITINKEDYIFATKNIKGPKVFFVPGVGIDTNFERCSEYEIKCFRKKIGLKTKESLILSVGELNKNKNHIFVIKALQRLLKKHPEIKWKYYICGQGSLKQYLEAYIKEQGLEDRICIVGFTNMIKKYLSAADLFIHPSYREGLSVALMEAIAAGIPVIASNIRGNRDLLEEEVLFELEDVSDIDDKLLSYFNDDRIAESVERNLIHIKQYDVKNVNLRLEMIYKRYE